MSKKQKTLEITKLLQKEHPEPVTELIHENEMQ